MRPYPAQAAAAAREPEPRARGARPGGGAERLAPGTPRPGFRGELFARLAQVEPGHFWFESRNRLLTGALRRHFPAARRFLEVGCGTGFVLADVGRSFPGWELAAGDLFPEALELARSRVPRARFHQVDARDMPFAAEFDVVGAFDVLEHIPEDEEVLRGMHRATRPGGGIVLTVPQHPRLWSAMDEAACHCRRYTRADLVAKVRRAGFRVERVTSFVTLLLPLMAASRLRPRRAGGRSIPEAEFALPGALNAALRGLLGVERRLIECGISLPAGGSLLLVGRRPRC